MKKIILVGHSFGGYVSQAFTSQQSEQVTALAVIGSTDITETTSVMRRIAKIAICPVFFN